MTGSLLAVVGSMVGPAAILKLTTLNFSSTAVRPADSICTATFASTGDVFGSGLSTHADEYLDLQGAGNGSPYEVQLSNVTGDTAELTGPTLNVFHALNVNRAWVESATGVPSKTINGTITIREIADTSNSVTASIQMWAELTD